MEAKGELVFVVIMAVLSAEPRATHYSGLSAEMDGLYVLHSPEPRHLTGKQGATPLRLHATRFHLGISRQTQTRCA